MIKITIKWLYQIVRHDDFINVHRYYFHDCSVKLCIFCISYPNNYKKRTSTKSSTFDCQFRTGCLIARSCDFPDIKGIIIL